MTAPASIGGRGEMERLREALSYTVKAPLPPVCHGALRVLRDCGAVQAKAGMRDYDALVARGLAQCVSVRGHTIFRLTAAGKERVA